MKVLAITVLVVGVFLIVAPVARACFCITPEVKQGFERARVVFVGEVLEIIPPRSSDKNAPFADQAQTIRFKVEITWKGPFWAEVNVLSHPYDCFSIHPERPGEKYIVYANPVSSSTRYNDLVIDACNRTTHLSASLTQPGLFEHLFGDNAENDIRRLNTVIMMSSPRPRPKSMPWLKFLEP